MFHNSEVKENAPKLDFFKISRKERLAEIEWRINWMLYLNIEITDTIESVGPEYAMYNCAEKLSLSNL